MMRYTPSNMLCVVLEMEGVDDLRQNKTQVALKIAGSYLRDKQSYLMLEQSFHHPVALTLPISGAPIAACPLQRVVGHLA